MMNALRNGPGLCPATSPSLRQRLGVCQWFHFQERAEVERSIALLAELNIKHLRTGISWADYYRPGGPRWYDWQMRRLADAGLEVLLSVWHTPPSISEGHACNTPPRRLRDYADFIDIVIRRYGGQFAALELWNEPNNRYKWDFRRFDPTWSKFAEMIGAAAYWARRCGQTTVLGGMIPVDPEWLKLIASYGVLDYIDVVAIHGFPGMWWPGQPNWDWHDQWNGWQAKLSSISPHAGGRPIWVTETGLATWDLATGRTGKRDLQLTMLDRVVAAAADGGCIERAYWYSLIDLDPSRNAIEGFHADENEYHMGLVTFAGQRKPAFDRLKELLSGAARRPEFDGGRGR